MRIERRIGAVSLKTGSTGITLRYQHQSTGRQTIGVRFGHFGPQDVRDSEGFLREMEATVVPYIRRELHGVLVLAPPTCLALRRVAVSLSMRGDTNILVVS